MLPLIVEGRFDELPALAGPVPQVLAPDDVRFAFDDRGTGWAMPPHPVPVDLEIECYDDSQDELWLEFPMWKREILTDLRLFLYLSRPAGELEYHVIVTEVRTP